jgi:hypothetical protein
MSRKVWMWMETVRLAKIRNRRYGPDIRSANDHSDLYWAGMPVHDEIRLDHISSAVSGRLELRFVVESETPEVDDTLKRIADFLKTVS